MAQPIAPEIWQEGIDDNTLLPNRYTLDIFTGSGVKIANNGEACRVWDIQVTDAIFDYDDRRLNGLAGPGYNPQGQDGWGASSYGVFQDVRFDSRLYTMGRHRSIAMRVFEENQYSGDIGEWGTATTSNVVTNGQSLMKTAALLNKAKDRWSDMVLGPDIDKYNLSAILQGHISGRWVDDYPDRVFTGEGRWVAQPGMVQGQAIPPRFAAVHCIEWDDSNIPLLLQNIKVTWNNLFIPQENRVFLIDPYYEYRLMAALWGKGIPNTPNAYTDMQNGSFVRLMGWDFRFDIPTQYWPRLYVDANLNVVHSADGLAPFDAIINSIDGGTNPDLILQNQLAATDRMMRTNFIRTVWDKDNGFTKVVTNYPLGQPGAEPYLGVGQTVAYDNYGKPTTYPFSGPGSGYGLDPDVDPPAGPTGPIAPIVRRQVIGAAIYRPAGQLSQEYSAMVTAEGITRGKFTEMCMDVKYDAWAIEGLSHGILPIIDSKANIGINAIPVQVLEENEDEAAVTSIAVTPTTLSIEVYGQAAPQVEILGTGAYDTGYTAVSGTPAVATIDGAGVIHGVSAGTATITYTSIGDPSKTATVTVTVA